MTGASGFLGRHVLEALEARPTPRRQIALVRDLATWHRMAWTSTLDRVDPLVGSVTQPTAWATAPLLNGLSGIIHLAAVVRHSRRNAREVYATNVEGTLGIVDLAATHHCRMVFVSTSGTVGCFRNPGEAAVEDSPYCDSEVAGWPYYRSKILAEQRARRLAGELGVELVIVRPPILLGPGDHRFRSTAHVVQYLRGRLPFLIRGGMHFADVRDAARALVRAIERRDVRPVYHLPGTMCSIEEFFVLAEQVSGAPAPRVVLPFRAAWWLATLFERLGLVLRGKPLRVLPDPVVIEMASRHWGVRSHYAEADLGYRTRDSRQTLADTISWLRENHPSLAAGTAGNRPA